MNKDTLMNILAKVAVVTSVLHATGVTLGHLGEGDFIDLASQAAQLVFNEINGSKASTQAAQAAPQVQSSNPLIGQR